MWLVDKKKFGSLQWEAENKFDEKIVRGITIAYKNICLTLYNVDINKPQHI